MFSIGQYLSQVRGDSAGSTASGTSTATTNTNNQVVLAPEPKRAPSRDYTQLIRTGENRDRVIQSSIDDVKPLRQRQRNISLQKPSEEQILECTERTRKALDNVLQAKLGTLKKDKSKPDYVRYTSSNILNDAPTSSRIIKIIDKQQDPMAPPKFKQKKQFERPPSPPAPILHAPTKKVTAEEQKQWYIPPAISNWKNPNGFTIALDKRLAVDGRDPSANASVEINEKFVNLADSLDKADQDVRNEIKIRHALKKMEAEKLTREKEERLRQLAQKTREDRARIQSRQQERFENEDERRRTLDREERRRKAERELKMSKMGKEQKIRSMAKTLGDRDISERAQLGVSKATKSIETQFDSRLFTKSTQITNSEDQVYDSELFVQQAISNIYKVSNSSRDQDPDEALHDLTSEKRFESLGPVQFEKSGEGSSNSKPVDESEYGLQVKRQRTE